MNMPPENPDFVGFLKDRNILEEDDARSVKDETRDFKEAAAQIALGFGLLSHTQLDQVLNANDAGAGFEQTALELGILNEQDVELLGQVGDLQRAVDVCAGLILAQKMSLESAATQLHDYFIQKEKHQPMDQ